MKLDDLLSLVDTRWHKAFLRFVDAGEADEDFLGYLDQDENCQRAVEMAFTAQAAAFEDFARVIRDSQTVPSEQIERKQQTATVSASIAAAFEDALDLTSEQRRDVVRIATSALEVSTSLEQKQGLKNIFEEFEKRFEGVKTLSS